MTAQLLGTFLMVSGVVAQTRKAMVAFASVLLLITTGEPTLAGPIFGPKLVRHHDGSDG
jgi:hypothetical protein